MNQLLKKDVKCIFGSKYIYIYIRSENRQEAFERLKEKLCEEPPLQRPDFLQPFILTTDTSGFAIAGILSQCKIGKDKPIKSKSNSDLSSGDEKEEEIQEICLNVEHENENEQQDILEIENSEN